MIHPAKSLFESGDALAYRLRISRAHGCRSVPHLVDAVLFLTPDLLREHRGARPAMPGTTDPDRRCTRGL
ncbi:MAG: hypothetical protein ACYCR4_13785 [Acidimicrobiales bacterium]